MPTGLQSGQPHDEAKVIAERSSSPTLSLGIRRGLARKCPACGKGLLFDGYLSVIPTCEVCGNDNEQYPSDDFAPYITIFLVLHILIPVFVLIDRSWEIPVFWELVVALPVFSISTLALLPFVKGAAIGFAWSRGVTRPRLPSG